MVNPAVAILEYTKCAKFLTETLATQIRDQMNTKMT